MLVDQSPESVLVVWENTMETQHLLSFCQPLQESVDHGVKLLCLKGARVQKEITKYTR